VFVGPLDEDEGGLHPLCGAVDLPILVRELDAVRPGAVDPIEEQIAAEWDSELLSVRVIGAAVPSDQMFAELLGDDECDDAEPYEPAGHVAPPPPVSPATLPPRTFAPPPPSSAPAPAPVLADLADLADPMPSGDRSAAPPRASRVSAPPRRWGRARAIVAVVFVVAVAAVGSKWLWRDRAPSESADRGQTAEPAQTLAGAPGVVPADTNASERDTSGASVGTAGETSDPRSVRPTDGVRRAELTDTGGRSGGTVLINPEDIHVIEEIRSNWPDQFFIHISSFRKSVEARSEVTFLESHEFPVFIVFLDLGAKGNWYRVYAGPFPTREAAREVKKSLDDIPSVRFTRITKIEE
jgi:cell division septation protein DedD